MPDEFRTWLGRGHALGPIHQRIFKDIETRLLSGEWRPGDRIPIEHDLVAQYQCSRMTVSEALSILVWRGLILLHRKTGSFVASPQIDRTVMDIQGISTEAARSGLTPVGNLLGEDAQQFEHHRRTGQCRHSGEIEGWRNLDHVGTDYIDAVKQPDHLLRLTRGEAAHLGRPCSRRHRWVDAVNVECHVSRVIA
jgi:DNA-binding transcriptional regulator YhcF (GntR family)